MSHRSSGCRGQHLVSIVRTAKPVVKKLRVHVRVSTNGEFREPLVMEEPWTVRRRNEQRKAEDVAAFAQVGHCDKETPGGEHIFICNWSAVPLLTTAAEPPADRE